MTLHLVVSGASWRPYYDLRAVTRDGRLLSKVALHYCANIAQTTGEDWTYAKLILSTANSQTLQSLGVPTVECLKIHTPFVPPPSTSRQPIHHGVSRMPIYSDVQVPTMLAFASVPSIPELPTTVLPEPAEVDHGNPLSLSFRISEVVSIPSDGLSHKVSIAVLDFSAQIKYVCVPRQKEMAFIEANVENTSAYELLAGPVSVFMDDGFVTKTSLGVSIESNPVFCQFIWYTHVHIQLVSVNQSFDCTIGIETALKVSYRQSSRAEQEPQRNFAEPIKTISRTVAIVVKNNNPFDISPLLIREVLPIGDDNATVTVVLVKPEGLARAKAGEEVSISTASGETTDVKVRWSKAVDGKGGEKDGMFEWVCSAPARGKVELEGQWDIKAPASVRWEEKKPEKPGKSGKN